ncbi:MAG: alpha/beta fold hydrolase, partial [Gammaproteobacteria bacterium]|nr:alpha/beta fold hydrolase [Gammaproteobacteria bacterium]
MHEEALLLGPGQSNVGVFTPAADNTDAQSDMAAICITAGLLHHVGPHRMHVLLARALTTKGISTLRFDLSGIGDSSVRSDDLPAQEVSVQEINDAINALEKRGFKRFILFGICSGAAQALRAATGNPKIAGLILVNTGSDDGNTEVDPRPAAQFYLKYSFWNLNAWKNLFTGKVKYRALIITLFSALIQKLKGNNKNVTSVGKRLQSRIQPFMQQGTSILIVLSDRHAQIYTLYQKAFEKLQCAQFNTLVYADTDHLFTSLSLQQDLIDRICQWSAELVDDGARDTSANFTVDTVS